MFHVTYIIRLRSDCKLLTLLNIFVFLMEMECLLCDVRIEFFFSAFAELRKATIGFVMSVRPTAWNKSVPTALIVIKFDI